MPQIVNHNNQASASVNTEAPGALHPPAIDTPPPAAPATIPTAPQVTRAQLLSLYLPGVLPRPRAEQVLPMQTEHPNESIPRQAVPPALPDE